MTLGLCRRSCRDRRAVPIEGTGVRRVPLYTRFATMTTLSVSNTLGQIPLAEREQYFLMPHCYVCAAADGIIALDTRHDEYLGFTTEDAQVLTGTVTDWPQCPTRLLPGGMSAPDSPQKESAVPPIADQLCDRQLITPYAWRGKPATPARIPHPHSIVHADFVDTWPKVNANHIVNVLRACVWAAASLRWRGLEYVIEHARHRKRTRANAARTNNPMNPSSSDLVLIYQQVRTFVFTARDRCLLDSLALTDLLATYGYYPSWIIAVRTKPFGAHSWVQDGNTVLNSPLATALEFTPIVVI